MMPPSMKPYLVRALHEWCCDQGYTPYISVKVDQHCQVPKSLVVDGYITFNTSYKAVKNLQIDHQWIEFVARFGGVVQQVIFPISAVVGVFSRETSEGMGFEPTDFDPLDGDSPEPEEQTEEPPNPHKPKLRILD